MRLLCSFCLALRPRGGTMIKVKIYTKNEIEMEIGIEPTDTIECIKERLLEISGIPPEVQRLIYAGRQLEEGRIAKDYNIEGGSVLHMVYRLKGGGPKSRFRSAIDHNIQKKSTLRLPLRPRGGTMIKVKRYTRNEIEMEIGIEPTDTIQRIKERVLEIAGIPPNEQSIIYADQELEDGKTAKYYNIKGGSVLCMEDDDYFLLYD